ncbi:MAG: lauroyl acyltransferase [Alphaproteobacteria bacterium]|nr:lauroyl acyltransferase [Alphaproteobacteria bacterium]
MIDIPKNKKIKQKGILTRFVQYPLEGIAAYTFYGIVKVLPIKMTSTFFGKLARFLSPIIPQTKIARRNLTAAFPDKSNDEIEQLIKGTWGNLGRIIGEFPHTPYIAKHIDDYVEFEGLEHLETLKKSGKPGLFISAHLGSWEISNFALIKCGMALNTFYREANNPLVKNLYKLSRGKTNASLLPKGSTGARAALRLLKNNQYIGVLVDQKQNDGIPVKFFGRDAMTAPAVAELSLRFDCPIIPMRIERIKGCKFKATIYPPLKKPDNSLKKKEKVAIMMQNINIMLEEWITERPEQWLWMHNRWPKNS